MALTHDNSGCHREVTLIDPHIAVVVSDCNLANVHDAVRSAALKPTTSPHPQQRTRSPETRHLAGSCSPTLSLPKHLTLRDMGITSSGCPLTPSLPSSLVAVFASSTIQNIAHTMASRVGVIALRARYNGSRVPIKASLRRRTNLVE